MFKHFALSPIACRLFVYAYWYVHCRFFQDNSHAEQAHLLTQVAGVYVEFLGLKALDAHRDFFFRYFPYAVANAVFTGFYYLCPGSRHLYTTAFKRILYLQIIRILAGLDVCPSSVQFVRQRVFPDDVADDDLDARSDSLPPLPKTNADRENRRNNANQTASSGTTSSSGGTLSSSSSNDDRVVEDLSLLQSSVSTSLLASRTKLAEEPSAASTLLLHSRSEPQISPALDVYVGRRDDLRFRPPMPTQLKAVLPRQRKVDFDTSQLSPLLQQYLETNPHKQKHFRWTAPVYWCSTGGTETYAKTPSVKDVNDTIQATFLDAKLAYKRDINDLRIDYKRSLKQLDQEKRRIQEGGAVAIGRYALDRVVEHMAQNN